MLIASSDMKIEKLRRGFSFISESNSVGSRDSLIREFFARSRFASSGYRQHRRCSRLVTANPEHSLWASLRLGMVRL
jgi:hypothetical protein